MENIRATTGLQFIISLSGIRPDNSYYSARYWIACFQKICENAPVGKPLSIVLDTIFSHMSYERVISPQELTQFSQTKWWPKLKVVSFGRFGLSNGVAIFPTHTLFKLFNLKKRTECCRQKYPVSGRIIRPGFF